MSVKFLSYIGVSGAAALGTTFLWKLLDDRDLLHNQGSVKPSAHCATLAVDDQRSLYQSKLCNGNDRLTFRSSRSSKSIKKAISRSRKLIQRTMLEQGIPGAQVAVTKNGRLVWSEGLGLADVENGVPCSPDSVMRIASISKPLTAVALLQLWEKGLVDLDAPIQSYVPSFPGKTFNGEKVVVTTRQLLTHLSGVRHYAKKGSDNGKEEFQSKEYYITTHFDTLEESMKLFAEDELLSNPGEEYHYSTHAWTLVSAVIENLSKQKFLPFMKQNVFTPLAMKSTGGEFHKPLLYNRASHYVRTKDGRLENVPYVDLSYKWAGGGLVSTAQDIVKFGTAVLASFNHSRMCSTSIDPSDDQNTQSEASVKSMFDLPSSLPNYILAPPTTSLMLTKVVNQVSPNRFPRLGYSLGWFVDEGEVGVAHGARNPMYFGHTGGAVGCSSALVVVPGVQKCLEGNSSQFSCCGSCGCVLESACVQCEGADGSRGSGGCCDASGVVVCVMFNLQEVRGMLKLGVHIANNFSVP